MPLANGFLTADQFADEFFFNLSAAWCPRCTLVQLVEQPRRELMFNDGYPFFSSSSARMQQHFAALARDVMAVLPANPFVVEIGSNDGTFLRHVAQAGHRHIGIEPSAGVAQAAAERGVTTLCRFFDVTSANEIVRDHGPAHAVIAANALSHIADPHAVVEGIALLLARDGTCVIEDPYWGDVVAATAFDQIYDEHASYFTLSSLSYLLADHGLEVIDATPVAVHGGSMRYWISHSGARSIAARVIELRDRERASGLHAADTFSQFRDRVTANGIALTALLRDCKARGLSVVGYGATSKSTTAINFFGMTPDLIEFISDTTPAKHGKFSPGAHIPIRSHDHFRAPYPPRALLFAWNHAAEVRAKETAFTRSGGRWIVYVPAVQEL